MLLKCPPIHRWAAHRCYRSFSPAFLLSQENVSSTMEKYSKMKPITRDQQGATRAAAVLIPICVVNNEVSLLYTLRARNLKRDRGQVSFPGGMEDAGDATPEQTALRETEEELGLKTDQVFVWGNGPGVMTKERTNITPVVGFLNSERLHRDIKFNPTEVKEFFTVSVNRLCDRRHTQFRDGYSLPVFEGGKRKIWGLTAIITHMFLKAFLTRNVYNSDVKFVPPLRNSTKYRFL